MGLKENVIIGKLIPAGTGMQRYQSIITVAPDAEPVRSRTAGYDEDLAEYLRASSGRGFEDLGPELLGVPSTYDAPEPAAPVEPDLGNTATGDDPAVGPAGDHRPCGPAPRGRPDRSPPRL